jgi:tRNA(fMet)-specific endonuclease VapC
VPLSLLDTDTLSAIMRGLNPITQQKAARYLSEFGIFRFSLITRYEILRGLKAKAAHRQLNDFERFCALNDVVPITDEVIIRAADYYADLRRRGQPIGDADLLIAATASVHGLVLVTTNTAHFGRIPGLVLDCWTTP